MPHTQVWCRDRRWVHTAIIALNSQKILHPAKHRILLKLPWVGTRSRKAWFFSSQHQRGVANFHWSGSSKRNILIGLTTFATEPAPELLQTDVPAEQMLLFLTHETAQNPTEDFVASFLLFYLAFLPTATLPTEKGHVYPLRSHVFSSLARKVPSQKSN